jgi:hypothetical protein
LATKAIEGGVDVKKKGKKKVGKLKPHSNGPNELNNNDLVVLKNTSKVVKALQEKLLQQNEAIKA